MNNFGSNMNKDSNTIKNSKDNKENLAVQKSSSDKRLESCATSQDPNTAGGEILN